MYVFRKCSSYFIVLLYFLGAVNTASYAESANYTIERTIFSIQLDGVTSDQRVMSTMIMPGDDLRVKTVADAFSDEGDLYRSGTTWIWRAPKTPGRHQILFRHDGDEILLNVFVLTPWQNGEQSELENFKIGKYAAQPFRGLATYKAPTGFIGIEDNWLDELVSPHFTLRQFLCKQQPEHDPTFLLVQSRMLVKLEALLEAVNDAGIKTESFQVMSGFRTPWYNASIGNRTTSSRHLFGGAADIFVDTNGNGWMDDLNKDGKIDKDDARVLAKIAEGLAAEDTAAQTWMPGGIGLYSANAVHGPFLHVDARGYQARW